MRELKFRAWWKKTRRFLDGDEWYMTCSGAGHLHYAICSYSNDDFVIEQYTGLKDKNCKEIYEGDIVEGTMGVFEVKWYDMISSFKFVPNIDMEWHPPFVYDQLKEMEVIGNIHENPELLEEK